MKILLLFAFYLILKVVLVSAENGCNLCLDSDHHKEEPGPEADLFGICSPWKQRSCCTSNTSIETHEQSGNNSYNFVFNHCSSKKNLSEKCLAHFVEDNCFYECSPNIGPWIVNEGNSYRSQRYKNVPLCAKTCMEWYEDCKDDYTCKENWSTGWNFSSGYNTCPGGEETCIEFSKMFKSPKDLCEKIYPDDFKVVENDEPCMQIWFEEGPNPNDEVAAYYEKQLGCGGNGAVSFYESTFISLKLLVIFICWLVQ